MVRVGLAYVSDRGAVHLPNKAYRGDPEVAAQVLERPDRSRARDQVLQPAVREPSEPPDKNQKEVPGNRSVGSQLRLQIVIPISISISFS